MDRYRAPGAMEYDRLDDLPEGTYTCRLYCSDCHTLINETKPMTLGEMKKNWVMIVMGSGLVTRPCFNCGVTTYSDLNIHTDLNVFAYDGDDAWNARQDVMTKANAAAREARSR